MKRQYIAFYKPYGVLCQFTGKVEIELFLNLAFPKMSTPQEDWIKIVRAFSSSPMMVCLIKN
jgi:16S rRNA U516 pseudouridylate synthase RsuA-like enzyme